MPVSIASVFFCASVSSGLCRAAAWIFCWAIWYTCCWLFGLPEKKLPMRLNSPCCWAHGLDIAGPLGADFPDTDRLRHIAWLAHRTLPYALSLAGEQSAPVRCELTAPDGEQVWRFGPPDAESAITGAAGEFCRVAAQRLDPARSGLRASGPHGATALRLVRTYAA